VSPEFPEFPEFRNFPVALDERANVYVGGFCQLTDTTEVPLLIKYDSAGNEQWATQRAPAPTGVGEVYKLAIDDSASVYCTGWYGAGIMSTDFLTAKYRQASGIAEGATPGASFVLSGSTVVRGVLFLADARGEMREARCELLDVSGRRVLSLKPGVNDVSRLSPGVYFVQAAGAARKFIVQR
jgi:hypothetical protein